MRYLLHLLLTVLLITLLACHGAPKDPKLRLSSQQLGQLPWSELLTRARGTTVNYGTWAGDETRNRYFQGTVAEELKRRFDITLNIVPFGDTAEMVNKLLNEKSAANSNATRAGSIDMLWINGENFRTARQADLLWGPFADQLPNIKFYDQAARERDFGTAIEGYEAPWQRGQFVIAYDSARVSEPPMSIPALRDWIKAHPGRFTYLAPPDFTGSAFIRHVLYHFGGPTNFQQGFNEELYKKAAAATIDYLNEIKPYLWRNGETYPTTPRELDRLFANNEVDFAMSYSPTFASERIKRGEYPASTRTFVFDQGTVTNYSFLAIPFNSSNTIGSLVVINYLMSPEHAIEKARQLGSIIPMRPEVLTDDQRAQVAALPRGEATLPAEVLASHMIPEADALYLERLEQDWLEKVLRR